MSRFSERHGLVSERKLAQIGGMDPPLRNRLWNCLALELEALNTPNDYYSHFSETRAYNLGQRLWHLFFKLPLDQMPSRHFSDFYQAVREWFMKAPWFQVYDILEFVAQFADGSESFQASCNLSLEAELSGYRFVEAHVAPITDKIELGDVEAAIAKSPRTVAQHLDAALSLLSNRKQPNYRKSVDESILAIEAFARSLSGKSKATLGDALKAINIDLHPALKEAFNKLYGYTSDESGIRHSLSDDGRVVDQADARYMLIVCSAFANYLRAKSTKKPT